ncbi:nucleotidyltransferase family protein [Rhizobium sp. S9]|uniref:nucleotidyltransferase family protein n=1 Tax=Rhizobium sp. S9 TaxID=2035454 RepID=UPI0032AE99B2
MPRELELPSPICHLDRCEERGTGSPLVRGEVPYTSTIDAIATFPTTAVGVHPHDGRLVLRAPSGLSNLLGVVVRANKRQITREVYEQKVDRWIKFWPKLTIVNWHEANMRKLGNAAGGSPLPNTEYLIDTLSDRGNAEPLLGD